MNQVIDYLKTTFTTVQLVVFGVIAVALIVAVILAIVFGCRRSRKNRAARKEEVRKQEEQKIRQSQLLTQVNSDIRQIETAMDETVRSAEKRKKELNDQEKIIADSEDVLNAADEAKFRDLADKESALSSLYKKQTTGPFKSMKKKKAAITLDTLEDVQADKGKLSDSIEARNRDRAYRKEILDKNLALIDTETEVRLYNLKAQRAELELKKHEIEAESEKANAVTAKKMTKKEAQKYALEQNRRKKAAEEEEERKAKEEVRLAKEAYEKEKQRRIQTEKEVELALATLRDSEKEKRRRENEERKRARKAQYMHPVAISSGNELLLLEYEEEKVNTIIADAEDETEIVTAGETAPATEEIIVTTAETEQTGSATEHAEEPKAETETDELPHEEVTTIAVEEEQTEEPQETEKTESAAEAEEEPVTAETTEETTEAAAPTETDVPEEAEQTAEESGYEAPAAEETEQTEEVAEAIAEETKAEEGTENEQSSETAENTEETKAEETGYEAPLAEETEQTEEVAETVTEEETAGQPEGPALCETKAEDPETADEEENTAAQSGTTEQENKEDNEEIHEEEEALENTEEEIDNAVETEEALIDAATEEETVEEAKEEIDSAVETEEAVIDTAAEEETAAAVAEPLPAKEEEKPVRLYHPIYTDGIPATPINKKNKYQKPLTKIVVKDPSKRRYSDLPAARLAAAQAEKKTSAAGETLKNKRNKELEQQALYNGKWVLEQNDIYYVATLYAANGEKMMQTEKYTSLSGIKNGIATIRKNMEAGNVTITRDNAGKFRFRIYSSGNRLLGTSESYSTEYQCEKALESAKKFSETAVTIRL